ncbi:MAG: hypothetical protein QXF61_04240 [Nitrososphaeria archaeon]
MVLYVFRVEHKKLATLFLLSLTLMFSFISASFSLQSSKGIPASGIIIYWPRVDITVDVSKVIGVNNLSLGFQLDWLSWLGFINYPVRRQLALEAGFKLVRVFDFRQTNPRLMPCIYWNESSRTGVWNWTNIDALVQKIFEIGAEPLFCLGNGNNIQNYIPQGMAINPITGLPYPESYAAYAGEWVKHFKERGLLVRFYQIINEPAAYFGWNPPNKTKLNYYVELWNTVARVMRAIDPNVKLSHDCITRKGVLEYWIQYGDDIDFLDFHKYDCFNMPPDYDETTTLLRAETRYFETGPTAWGVDDARRMWYNARGKWLPVINSESNLNAYCATGTDPRIQQMFGAVWTSLVLRTGILKGLSYNVYFEFSSSKSYGETTETGGYGFGMINSDNNKPWYPYYVHYMIGSNLSVGDLIVETTSSSDDLRALAWIHNQKLNVLLICKVNKPITVILNGIQGEMKILKIDGTISWTNPSLQTQIVNAGELIIFNGYTIAVIQAAI